MSDTYAHDLSAEDETDQPEPVIDWEARCGQMATENIRQAARYKGKITSQGERIQELERINDALRADVARMKPAHEKRIRAEKALDDSNAKWAERLNEANGIIRELRIKLQRGQKGVINDIINDLTARYRGMPNPIPGEDISADGQVVHP